MVLLLHLGLRLSEFDEILYADANFDSKNSHVTKKLKTANCTMRNAHFLGYTKKVNT